MTEVALTLGYGIKLEGAGVSVVQGTSVVKVLVVTTGGIDEMLTVQGQAGTWLAFKMMRDRHR